MQVQSSALNGLRFFYSEIADDMPTSLDIATAAKQVHAVVSDVFSRSAVLPFRYPTVVNNSEELEQLSRTKGEAFRAFLERVGMKVEMDIRLAIDSEAVEQPASGRAYLDGRAQRQALISAAAEKCRQTANPADWRIQQRGENLRCQALMERVEVVSFLERMRTLELPGGVKAAISGPWPPAGFWENEPD